MKKLLTILALVLFTVVVWAQPITEQQAKDRALKYLNNNSAAQARGVGNRQMKLDAAKVEAKSIYAFNIDGGGYVIASGDSRTLPVLGYASQGRIDWDRMPDNMRAWLKSYDKAIATLGHRNFYVDGHSKFGRAGTRATKTAIEPMLKTVWGQDHPYNDKTPPYEGANPDWQGMKSATGCVATAMAQIMYYHRWPELATKEIPAYDLTTAHENVEKVWHIDALPPVVFDWENMRYTYYSEEDGMELGTDTQNDAVATLMRYCGQGVRMYYSPEGSASNDQAAFEALVKYFDYDPALYLANRIHYGIDEWEQLIYDELAAGRPVCYGGQSDDLGGHAFVCDGYDGNGLFHMNWGWTGDSNGFFSLSVLDPYIDWENGSGSTGVGFNVDQDAIIGFKPAPANAEPKAMKPNADLDCYEPIFVLEPDTIGFKYLYGSYTYGDMRVDYAVGTCDDNGKLTPKFFGDPADSIVYNWMTNFHTVKVDSTALKKNEHLVLYPMVKFPDIPDADWQMLGSKEYCVFTGRDANGDFYLTMQIPDLEIKKAEFTKGEGRLGTKNNITLTIYNHGLSDCTMPLFLVPYYFGDVDPADLTADTEYSEGEAVEVGTYLHAGKEDQATFCLKPLASGLVYLVLYMPNGTPLADAVIQVSDTFGTYNDYVINESEIYLDQDADGRPIPCPSVYGVKFTDNPESTVPQGKPAENIYLYACVADVNNTDGTFVELGKECIDYLTALPEKAGDGKYELTYDLPYEITRGGMYYALSYMKEWLSQDKYFMSGYKRQTFEIYDNPRVRVLGETSVPSGQPFDLKFLFTSGWPYNPADFTGAEEAQYTLYRKDGENGYTALSGHTGKINLTFNQGQPELAVVDTLAFTETLPDGEYSIGLTTTWEYLLHVPVSVDITVGATGISSVVRDDPNNIYTDLQGRRLQARPARKGIYIRNGKKLLVK